MPRRSPPTANLRHVPEPGEMPAEKDTASPISAQEVSPNSRNKVRAFNINIAGNKLPVRKIIVYENDVVRINLTVSDNPYTLSFPELNIAGTARKEENVRLEFQAVTPGSFNFICGECQSPSKGELIVVPGFSPGKTDNYK